METLEEKDGVIEEYNVRVSQTQEHMVKHQGGYIAEDNGDTIVFRFYNGDVLPDVLDGDIVFHSFDAKANGFKSTREFVEDVITFIPVS